MTIELTVDEAIALDIHIKHMIESKEAAKKTINKVLYPNAFKAFNDGIETLQSIKNKIEKQWT